MLNHRFSKAKYSVLQWLTDRTYRPVNGKVPVIIEKMQQAGIPRGYNSFVQNFDEIVNWLLEQPDFKKRRTAPPAIINMLEIDDPNADPLRQLLRDHRDKIFSDYLPIPNRSLLVLDAAATGLYAEGTTFDMLNVLNTMLSIDKDFHDKSPTTIENRTARILAMMSGYYKKIFETNLSKKPGLFRKNAYAGRGNLSFRAVITSHEDIHDEDEIYIPWCVAAAIFQLQIVPKLMAGGVTRSGVEYRFTENEAVAHMYGHIYRFCPILSELFDQLIEDSPGGYIGCEQQRNPSLSQGSAQFVRITRIKKNPWDMTVSMSDLIAQAMNA
jgi:hypothetical protein